MIARTRRRLLGVATTFCLLPRHGFASPELSLRVTTSNLPPLVMENGGERPGALYELVIELCRRMKVRPVVEFVPWRRAVFLSTTLPSTAIFPLTRSPEREEQYRWLAPLYEENYVFIGARGRHEMARPATLKPRRIAMLRGSTLIRILNEMDYPHIVEAASVDEVFRFVDGGMADVAFGERAIVRNALHSRKREADFDMSQPVRTTTSWLAASRDFTPAQADQFQRAMKQLIADGGYERIMKKYSLH